MELSPEKKIKPGSEHLGWQSVAFHKCQVIQGDQNMYFLLQKPYINATYILYVCVDVLVYHTMCIFIRLASISHYKQIMNQSRVWIFCCLSAFFKKPGITQHPYAYYLFICILQRQIKSHVSPNSVMTAAYQIVLALLRYILPWGQKDLVSHLGLTFTGACPALSHIGLPKVLILPWIWAPDESGPKSPGLLQIFQPL